MNTKHRTKTILPLATVAMILAPFANTAKAAIIKVDNRDAATSVIGWNVADDVGKSPFVFEGLTFTYTNFSNSGANNYEGAFDGTFWDGVANDRFFSNSTVAGSVAISGLNDALTYNLQLIATDENSNRAAAYQVNGSFGDVVGPLGGDGYDPKLNGYDNADVMTFSNVSPSSEVITITVISATVGQAASLSAFTIEEVPEPSTAALLGLSGLALMRRRRRRA